MVYFDTDTLYFIVYNMVQIVWKKTINHIFISVTYLIFGSTQVIMSKYNVKKYKNNLLCVKKY